MALPPIVLAEAEPIRLYSPDDPAIDPTACADALKAYASGEDLDVTNLVLVDGEEPTVFVVRALTPRELRVARARFPEFEDGAPDRERITQWVEMLMHLVRFGLVRAEGWDGWTAEREPHEVVPTLRVWSEDVIGAIPESTLLFLGMAIFKLSTLDDAKKKPSGSSRGAPGGTVEAKARTGAGTGRARSRAKSGAGAAGGAAH